MNDYLFATALAIVPSAAWFLFWWSKDNQKEPPLILLKAFLYGCLSAFVLLPLRYSLPVLPLSVLLIMTALLEEGVKSFATVYVTEKNYRLFDQVIDGIVYGVAVAMGFAFIENIIYLSEFLASGMDSDSFWIIYFLRSTTTTFAHSIFTGMFGFAYANAYLLPDDFIPEVYHGKPFACTLKKVPAFRYRLRLIWEILTLHVLFVHVLKNQPSTYKHTSNHLIFEGIMSAIYLHLIFDIFAMIEFGGKTLAFLLPGLVLLTGWRLVSKFGLKRYKQIIHRHFPPVEVMRD